MAAVDNEVLLHVLEEAIDAFQVVERVAGECLAGLDLDGMKAARRLNDDVTLEPLAVPIEREIRSRALIESVLEHLTDDGVLEQIAAQRVCCQLALALNADQVTRQADVVKIQLWRFDQAFSDVGEVGW